MSLPQQQSMPSAGVNADLVSDGFQSYAVSHFCSHHHSKHRHKFNAQQHWMLGKSYLSEEPSRNPTLYPLLMALLHSPVKADPIKWTVYSEQA